MENSSLSLMANSSLSLMATEGLTRDKYAYLARRAQQAGRYEEMVSFMEKLVVGSSSADEELTDKERDLLCDAYKNVIGSRRAALLILSSIEQKELESLSNNEEHASLVKRYRSKVESELLKIFDGVVELLDEYLVPSASTSESSSKASSFYQKMKKDCHRFLDKNHHPLALSPTPMAPMATEELTRDQYVYFAKLAKQAKRYEEMASFMEKVVVGSSSAEEFTDEERDLLYVAYKNVIGSLRKAWRILSSIEKNDENASLVKEYRWTVETQLSEMCSGIVKLLDDHLLISPASTSESKVFYWKMKGDCYYANKDALLAYKSAMHIAMADLAPTHPIRLGLGLGHTITKQTIEEAITELDTLDEESYMDRTLVKQLLRDKLTLGTSNLQGEIELSRDVLAIIVKGLCRDDFVRFSGVCKLWRSVAVENMICLPINLFPGLVARVSEEENETRSLLLLNHETGYFEENSNLVIPNGHVCRGSAFGWLFMTTEELDTLLLNPFSGSEIKLPSVRTLPDRISQRFNPISKSYIQKAIISSNPSSQIPFVFIFYGGEEHSRCAFCRPGDQSWIPLNCPGNNMDAIYYNDQFYVLALPGSIRSFKIQAVQADYSVSETLVALAPTQHFRTRTARLYLVELNGEFFKLTRVLTREITDEDGEIWRKYGFVPYVAVSSDEELLHEEQGFSGTVMEVEPVDSESVEEPADSESVEESVESAEDVIDDNVDAFLENNYVDIDDDIESFVTDDERLAFLDNYQDNNDDGKVKFRYQITGFKIQKFEAESWVDVEHFGEAALFLGYNNTFSVQASEFRGCIPSSIYFSGTEGLRGRIFNLTDGTFTSPRPHPEDEDASQPPAVWVDYTSRLLGVADLWFDN